MGTGWELLPQVKATNVHRQMADGFLFEDSEGKNKRDKLGGFSLKTALSARSRSRCYMGRVFQEGGGEAHHSLPFPIQQQAGSEQQNTQELGFLVLK